MSGFVSLVPNIIKDEGRNLRQLWKTSALSHM